MGVSHRHVAPCVIVATVFLLLPLAKYLSLHSTIFDLGLFVSFHHRIAILSEWQSAFSGHAQIFSLPYAMVYRHFPSDTGVYFLIGSQALLLLLPAYCLLRRYGVFAAFAYIAYIPVWVNAHFDFHFDHLAVPLLLAFYWALVGRRVGWAVVSATLLMLVKEPFALQTAACGALLLWAGIRGGSIWGRGNEFASRGQLLLGAIWLLGIGVAYFYFATHSLFPYFSPDGGRGGLDGEGFGWLGRSLSEMLLTLVSKPHIILWEIITTPGKLYYLAVTFGSILFISFFRPVFLIPAIPLLGISMLSDFKNYYDYNTHYTAGLIIPVIFSFIYGLPRAHGLWMMGAKWLCRKTSDVRAALQSRAIIVPHPSPLPAGEASHDAVAAMEMRLSKVFYVLLALWILSWHVMLSPSPISRLFWSDKVWSFSGQAYVPTDREVTMKEAMLKYIPADPEVSVASQNTVNWEHLARRRIYVAFPNGVTEPMKVVTHPNQTLGGFWRFARTGEKPLALTHGRYADYVVLDLKRPWFIADKGCEWIYGECRDKAIAQEFLDLVSKTEARYETLFEYDGFMILRRR